MNVLTGGAQKLKASVHLKLVGVRDQINCGLILQAREEAAVKWLLREEGAAEVQVAGHHIHINVGGELPQEGLEAI
jgi:hypothetical protein